MRNWLRKLLLKPRPVMSPDAQAELWGDLGRILQNARPKPQSANEEGTTRNDEEQ